MRCGKSSTREKVVPLKEYTWRSLTDDLSARKNHHVICDAQDVLHTVRYKDNADAAFPMQHGKHGEQRLAPTRVEPCCRLIEDKVARCKGKHACDRNAPALPARKRKGRAISISVGQADELHRFADTCLDIRIRKPLIARAKGNILIDRFLEQLVLGILKDHADAKARCSSCFFLFLRFSVETDAVHKDPSRRRNEKPADQLHQCGFSRARFSRNRRK